MPPTYRVRTSDFDFPLPDELIAQHPAPTRAASRLLVINRGAKSLDHKNFADLPPHLRKGDLLVLNDSKVIPARMRAVNAATGGRFELLLLEENRPNDWWAMMRPAKRAQVGTTLTLIDLQGAPTAVQAVVRDTNAEGHRRLEFIGNNDIDEVLSQIGELPLPPYIKRPEHNRSAEDLERYQTIYAREPGSVAAPTAGLHFTSELLSQIRALGVEVCSVTLHVGLGTFAPVKAEEVEAHTMHFERFHVTGEVAQKISLAKQEGRRVIAVGTTSVRVLESVAREHDGKIVAGTGRTNIFIYPPYSFRIVDALVTNFHLPKSTLLMLVSAFASPGQTDGREFMLHAYAEAVRNRYRFFSYGDAMFIH